MKLTEHIEQSELTVAAYAALIEVSVRAVRRYVLPASDPRAQIPHRSVMRRIYVQSGGRVRPDDFYDLPELAEQAA